MKNNPSEVKTADFLRLVSKESGYNLSVVKSVYKAFIIVLLRLIVADKSVYLFNLFSTKINLLPSYKSYDGVRKEYYIQKPSVRIIFTAARIFKKMYREYNKNFPRESNE